CARISCRGIYCYRDDYFDHW
nr:immunoglobulin heavy chain junction region [Macaca mulatta]MOY30338.1 immunoglobulin heavy chain junction region [Macaca mulatta]